MLVPGQQRRVFGQLSRVDLPGGDTPQDTVGPSQLVALPVLAAVAAILALVGIRQRAVEYR